MRNPVPRYAGLMPASARASEAARSSSRKRDTRAEQTLRRALWARGLRYRIDAADLPGRPDLVFRSARVVVFCDGDFWHGRDLQTRLSSSLVGTTRPTGWRRSPVTSNVTRNEAEHSLNQAGSSFASGKRTSIGRAI